MNKKKPIFKPEETVEVLILQWKEKAALYVNNLRIAGPKLPVESKCVASFQLKAKDLLGALDERCYCYEASTRNCPRHQNGKE